MSDAPPAAPVSRRETALAAIESALRAVAEAHGASFGRNDPAARDEIRRPAILLYDGDEEEPLVTGPVHRGAAWRCVVAPVVVIRDDGPVAVVGPLLSAWLARCQAAVFGSAALRGLARAGDGSNLGQAGVEIGLEADAVGAVGTLIWRPTVGYDFDPINP